MCPLQVIYCYIYLSWERLPNVYGYENFTMDEISNKVKRGANFLGLYMRKIVTKYPPLVTILNRMFMLVMLA